MVLIPQHHLPAKAEKRYDNAVVLKPAVTEAEAEVEAEVETERDTVIHSEGKRNAGQVPGIQQAVVPTVTAAAVAAVAAVTVIVVLKKTTTI